MLVDGTPQQIRLAAQCHEHLVKVPRAARLAPHRPGALGESSTEFVTPATDRFVVTTTPRSSNNSSMSRKLRLNRKYHRTAQLMTTAGKRWP